jgi:hypothetical protein
MTAGHDDPSPGQSLTIPWPMNAAAPHSRVSSASGIYGESVTCFKERHFHPQQGKGSIFFALTMCSATPVCAHVL